MKRKLGAQKCTDEYLNQLAELEFNWNSWHDLPIDDRAIRAVKEFRILYLSDREHLFPNAVPTNKGGIILAWEGERYTLEFGPDGEQVRE